MIELTYSDAVDAIFNRINTDWNDGRIAALLGYQPVLHFQGRESSPDSSKLWGRVSQQTVSERQSAIGNNCGGPALRRYEIAGLVFVQLFCPKTKANGFELSRRVATISRNAFRGKYAEPINLALASGNHVAFYNVRIVEVDPENDLFRFNVVAEYEYDEIG